MPITAWITVFGIVVAAIVTLTVAYLQRKQMRQIELHRADPSIPVTAPPHGIILFFKRTFWYWYCLLFGGYDFRMLIKDLSQNTPVTRTVIFDISLDMIGISFMVLLVILAPMMSREAKAAEITSKMLDVLIGTVHKVEEIEKSQKTS